jgi:hypothetical protein
MKPASITSSIDKKFVADASKHDSACATNSESDLDDDSNGVDVYDYDDFTLGANGQRQHLNISSKRREGSDGGRIYSSKHMRIRENRPTSKR